MQINLARIHSPLNSDTDRLNGHEAQKFLTLSPDYPYSLHRENIPASYPSPRASGGMEPNLCHLQGP